MANKKLSTQQKLQLLQVQAATDRAEMLQHMLQYAQTDLLCYLAAEEVILPGLAQTRTLRARQAQHFTPVLEWAATTHGIMLQVTDGIMPAPQPQQSIDKFAAIFAAANDAELAALSMLVPMLGSAMLALALWHKQVGVEEALTMARLDEDVQAEAWGADPHATAEWEIKCQAIREAAFFLTGNALK